MAAQRGHPKWGGRKRGVPNKVTGPIKAAFRKHGDELVKGLMKLTKSKDERVRLGAIQAAFDRGWGKAVQSMEIDMPVAITSIERRIIAPNTEAAEAVVAESAGKPDRKAAKQATNGAGSGK